MDNILESIGIIREYINHPRKQNLLLVDRSKWNILCASLDSIEDATLALDDYLKSSKNEHSIGFTYVIVYGVLQALILQQDALENIGKALEIELQEKTELKNIREIRNSSSGHPIREFRGEFRSANYIQQFGMTITRFSMMTYDPKKADPIFLDIQIPELVNKQNEIIQSDLQLIIDALIAEEKVHKEQYMNNKTEEYFNGFGYSISKLYESIHRKDYIPMSLINLKGIANSIAKFKSDLSERKLLGNVPGIDIVFDEIDYPMNKLLSYFERKISLDDNELYVYIYFCHRKIEELISMAKEIDEEYKKPK